MILYTERLILEPITLPIVDRALEPHDGTRRIARLALEIDRAYLASNPSAFTDTNGQVRFTTIYPGFYQGRAVHIHVKIHPTKTSQVTTQLYFPDELSRTVFTAAQYSAHRGTFTPNAQDGIYRDGGGK